MRTRLVLPALALLVAACGGVDETASPSPSPSAPTPSASTATPTFSPPDTEDATDPTADGTIDPALGDLVETAVADLAARLEVDADAITVVSAQVVAWGDTSLGCPQPGMRYAQVVTDGSKVVLEHDGTTYPYHAGGNRPDDPFLCEQQPPEKTSPNPDLTPR